MRQREERRNSASHAESMQEQLHQKQPTKPQQPPEPLKSRVKSAQLTKEEITGEEEKASLGVEKKISCSEWF